MTYASAVATSAILQFHAAHPIVLESKLRHACSKFHAGPLFHRRVKLPQTGFRHSHNISPAIRQQRFLKDLNRIRGAGAAGFLIQAADDHRVIELPHERFGLIVRVEPFAKRDIRNVVPIGLRHVKHRLSQFPSLGESSVPRTSPAKGPDAAARAIVRFQTDRIARPRSSRK